MRLLSCFLALIMVCVNALPASLYASQTGDAATPAVAETTVEDQDNSQEKKEEKPEKAEKEQKEEKEEKAEKPEKEEEIPSVHTVSISKSSISLQVGESEKLSSEVLPENAKERGVIWKSSAEDVASVDQQGKVTAKSAGKAKITVTTKDQGLTAACQVEVSEKTSDDSSASDEVSKEEEGRKEGNEKKSLSHQEDYALSQEPTGSRIKARESSDDSAYSTSLADGTYTDFDFDWSGGTGKAHLTLEKVVVSKGIARGVFRASSASMTHVYYAGHTGSDAEDPAYYDPDTETCGKNVLVIKDQSVTFPVKLNKTQKIACRTTAMSVPHWIGYEYNISLSEPTGCKVKFKAENEDEETLSVTLSVKDSSGNQMKPEGDYYELDTDKSYTVTAEAEGYETWKGTVSPAQDGQTIILVMEAKSYQVTIKVKDQDSGKELEEASVLVTDEKTGKEIPGKGGVYTFSGAHKYTVEVTSNDDYEDIKKEHVSVSEDQTMEITLKAIDEDNVEKYNLTVVAKNEAGNVIGDAKVEVARETSTQIISVKPVDGSYPLIARKNYKVTVTAEGYQPASGTVQISKDQTETFVLERACYDIHVRAIESATQYNLSKAVITVKDETGKIYEGENGTYVVPYETGLTIEGSCNGYESTDGNTIASQTLKVTGEETVILTFRKRTYTVKTSVVDASTGKAVSGARLVVTNSETDKTVSPSGGGYPMTYATVYTIAASATGYAPAAVTHKATTDTTLTIKMTAIDSSGSGGRPKTEQVVNNGTYNIKFKDAENSMFNVVSAVLHVKDGRYTADISLSGKGYDYVYPSSAEAAIKAGKSKWSKYWLNKKGLYTYTIEVPYLDKPFILASRSIKYANDPNMRTQAWRDGQEGGAASHGSHEIILYSKYTNGKNLPTHAGTRKQSSIEPATDKNSKGSSRNRKSSGDTDAKGGSGGNYSSNTNGSTGSVNNRTGLTDGSYKPDSFSFSGGTGKVKISCDQVIIKGGKTYARIIFGSTFFQYVKAGGQKITNKARTAATTSFVIPVELNKNNKILALTTKMSQPHEIGYTIYVGLNAAKSAAAAVSADGTATEDGATAVTSGKVDDQYDKLDEKAPEIIGLTYEKEIPVLYSDKIKMYQYKDGYTLIELDVRKDTALDKKITGIEVSTAEEETAAAEGTEEESAASEEKTESEQKAALYDHAIYKYLVVPEKGVIPAGIEKQLFVVQLPADQAVITSPESLEIMNDLGLNDKILGIGIPSEEITVKSLADAMEAKDGKEPEIYDIGSYDKPDYKILLLNHADVLLESAKIIPHLGELEGFPQKTGEEFKKLSEEEKKTYQALAREEAMKLKKIGMRGVQLNMGVLVDRSPDEKNDLAKAEWLKVYGVLFDKSAETDKLYQNIVSKATEEEKKAAAVETSTGGNSNEN